VAVLPVCSTEWVVDGAGALTCTGALYNQSAPVGWSMSQSEVADVLSAVFLLFALAFGVRTLVRFLDIGAGRGN